MTIQIARRIGRALGVRSGTRIKELDAGLLEYARLVPQAPTVPLTGVIDATQVTTGVFADARISESSVEQHEAALEIDWMQLTDVPTTFPVDLEASGDGSTLGDYADDTAAAGGGVALGGFYRTGSVVKVRVA